jgi:ferric-dicitrate binding protein FerR (iron transport regulator)
MSDSPLLSRAAARVLAEDTREKGPTASQRASTIAAMQLAMRESAKRRARLRALSSIGSVAGIAALAAGIWLVMRAPGGGVDPARVPTPIASELLAQSVDGDVFSEGTSGPRALEAGAPLRVGDVVSVRAGRAMLLLATGTRVTLPNDSVLGVLGSGKSQAFELRRGGVRADVTKLTQGERFVIRTSDAEIEVRGTSFDVGDVTPDPRCGAGTRTRVRVTEGVVVVRAHGEETRVPAGDSWPAGCDAANAAAASVGSGNAAAAATAGVASSASAPTTMTASPPAAPSGPAATRGAAAGATAPIGTAATTHSALREQNDLFEAALAQKRRGETAAAIATLDRLLARYPHSHLAESAAAEHMKLLAVTDPARGAEAARDYLARYPNGFARKDAERLATIK